jgi:PmbA protein
MNTTLQSQVEAALEAMNRAGFEHFQAAVVADDHDEMNIFQNKVNLFRTVSKSQLSLKGIVQGKKATRTITVSNALNLASLADELFQDAQQAPEDDANSVSEGIVHDYVDGPITSEKDMMVQRIQELFSYRSKQHPKVNLNQGALSHKRQRTVRASSQGTLLRSDSGWYEMFVLAVGKEGQKLSSMSYTVGTIRDLDTPLHECFQTDELLTSAEKQIHTQALSSSFRGSALLNPFTAIELVNFLTSQVSDQALLASASMYAEKVGQLIASPNLTIRHHAQGPGVASHTAGGYLLDDFDFVRDGVLQTLLPSQYASKRLDLNHRPSGSCFSIDAGTTPKAQLLSEIERGAYVGRLSMGRPAANGDFSAAIKNSFLVEDGKEGTALKDTMMTGNITQMLQDIDGISLEKLDFGLGAAPWLRIPNLMFS